MQYQPDQNNETMFLDDYSDYMSNGWYSFTKRIFWILVNANTMLLMVILNKNMGLRVAKRSESIFALIWLVVLFNISIFSQEPETGVVDETLSAPIIMIHGILFAIFAIWRKVGAWWNMRNSGKPGFIRRLDYGIGDSVVYPVIRAILKPLRLVDHEANPKTLWKMTEDRWMQIWQPLMLLAIGVYFIYAGYEVYGKFLLLATVCFFYVTFRAFDNTARMRQAQVDAEIAGEMINPMQQENNRHVIGE
ncbi:MAG: hypothetical protein MI974_12830 [Chitinophagales bacterium]|nr:hypothetical protein [Chitinophagales bacterium]